MNKHLLFFAVIIITTLLSSCSKEIEPSPEVQTKSTLEYRDVALLLTSANIDIDICNEVSKAAKQSIEKQRDENYLFSEILKPEEVKTKVSDIQNSLLKKALTEVMTKSSSIDLDELANSNMEIYWPYSEYWDGETMPVITYYRSDEELYGNITSGSVWAYKLSTGTKGTGYELDSILVDEEYAVNNPVWVINSPSTMAFDGPVLPIEDEPLPDDPGTGGGTGGGSSSPTAYAAYQSLMAEQGTTPESNTRVHAINLGYFKSEKQHDSWLDGGSEYVVKMGSLVGNAILDSSNVGLPIISYYSVNLTRAEIREGVMKKIDFPLVSNCPANQLDIPFMIYENDGGKDKQWDFSLHVDILGYTLAVDLSFFTQKRYDMIIMTTYAKDYIFSTINCINGTGWKTYTADGISWTLPYSIGNSTY